MKECVVVHLQVKSCLERKICLFVNLIRNKNMFVEKI